jgi:predicted nuclease of predicted toxin-antitoxin system
VNFVLDENLAEALGDLLGSAGHGAVHVRNVGLQSASDLVVLDYAASQRAVLISADADFGSILAATHRTAPSLVLLRHERGRRVGRVADMILDNLDQVMGDLEAGAIVVIEDGRVRVRRLPIWPRPDLGRRQPETTRTL